MTAIARATTPSEPSQTAVVSNPRRLGSYYTPADLASAVVKWSLNGQAGRFLDPSFGGCSFLHAAAAELQDLNPDSGLSGIYGVDIDPKAKGFAAGLVSAGLPTRNVLVSDFFSVRPSDLGGEFDAVVANPPYIRHHRLTNRVFTTATRRMRELGVTLDGRADCWAYFALYATRFVKAEGRLVLLLPAAVLHADYAKTVLRYLGKQFRSVAVLRLYQRFFTGTDEQTVVICASNDCKEPRVRYYEIPDLSSLERALGRASRSKSVAFDSVDRNWKMSAISYAGSSAWSKVARHPAVMTLGDIATIRIGVVTGANSFFIRKPSEVAEWRQPGLQARSVVRGRTLGGATWTTADVARARKADSPSQLILINPRARLNNGLLRLVREGERLGLNQRFKCSAREPWYACNDTLVPDAFLPYMSARSVVIIDNRGRSLCTNSIHRIWWREQGVSYASLVAASWTSLFALGSELFGRFYSGGVLKVEPSEAARIRIPRVEIASDLVDRIDDLARAGQYTKARELADHEVLVQGMGLSVGTASALGAGADTLRIARNRAIRL